MRILLLTSSYAPVLGGLQSTVSALANEWHKSGNVVNVVTQRHPHQLPGFEEINDISVWRRIFLSPEASQLYKGRPDLFLAGLYYRPATSRWLARKIDEFQPDVINLHFPDSQIPFLQSLQKHISYRVVVSLHGHEVLRWFDESGNLESGLKDNARKLDGLKRLFQTADAVTACSQYLLDKASQIMPMVRQKGYIIQNGADRSRFDENIAYQHSRRYCFAFGRLTGTKGFDLLVRAFAEIAVRYPELDLILAGDGEQKDLLVRMTNDLGLNGRMIYFGRAAPEHVVQLLNGCDFLIIPSRVETFGLAAVEGMAAGKPIVATRVGGLPEILDGTLNLLIEPTVEGLITGIDKLLLSKDRNLIGRQNKVLAEKFSWKSTGNKYLQIFDSA
jgi:glycosyltransferase involved in cell wall biosynthesis